MAKDVKPKKSKDAEESADLHQPVPTVATTRLSKSEADEPEVVTAPPRPKPAGAQWYAIHTYSGHEAKVEKNIRRRAEAQGLESMIVDTFIPEEKEMRVVGGKTREVKRKMFPGYVFIEMVLDATTFHLVKSTTGVTGFLSSGDKPIPLKDHEVRQLQEVKEGKQPPRVEFEKGDIVRVTQGPFAEFTGKIDEVMLDKQKLRVLIELFGRDTPVELAFNEVDKEIAEPTHKKK